MISIAMATYNGSTFIQQQINSILSQSYSDFELIICDDCSTDNTWNLLNEFASEDSRIHCYQNEKKFCCKKNFEKVISCSRQYIALADQDVMNGLQITWNTYLMKLKIIKLYVDKHPLLMKTII